MHKENVAHVYNKMSLGPEKEGDSDWYTMDEIGGHCVT